METRQLGELLPDEGLAVIAQFKAELADGKYDKLHYLDLHAKLRDKLQLYKEYLARKGMEDIDYFVLATLIAIGTKVPDEYKV